MERARSADEFVAAPIGRWHATTTTLVWCASAKLGGVVAWGRPTPAETRENTELFRALEAIDEPLDLVMDGRGVEAIDLAALTTLLEWARGAMPLLRARIARRVGLIPDGAHGLVLAGLSPVLGWMSAVSLADDLPSALRALDVADPAALAARVDALVAEVRSADPVVVRVRALLRAREGRASLAEVARELALSARTLQRALGAAGTTFRAEEHDARFEIARELLASTDEKVAVIARRLGVTEGALVALVRARTGLSPTELRRERSSA